MGKPQPFSKKNFCRIQSAKRPLDGIKVFFAKKTHTRRVQNMDMDALLELFCSVDDFWKAF